MPALRKFEDFVEATVFVYEEFIEPRKQPNTFILGQLNDVTLAAARRLVAICKEQHLLDEEIARLPAQDVGEFMLAHCAARLAWTACDIECHELCDCDYEIRLERVSEH